MDCCVIGDQFDVRKGVGGALLFTTSDILSGDGTQSGAFDGDTAWANALLSKGEITLGAGSTDIGIDLIRSARGFTTGAGFIRLDVTQVPEPGTLTLLGVGVVLLALGRRLRRAA